MPNRVFFPKFSDAEYRSRWQRIRDAMDTRALDCLVIYGGHDVSLNEGASGNWGSRAAGLESSAVSEAR